MVVLSVMSMVIGSKLLMSYGITKHGTLAKQVKKNTLTGEYLCQLYTIFLAFC